MRDPQPTGVYATDVAGARMLGVLADILDNTVDPSRLSTDHLAYAATVAIHRLREWGIHPGQRDADGLPVPPPHDDNCQVCGGER